MVQGVDGVEEKAIGTNNPLLLASAVSMRTEYSFYTEYLKTGLLNEIQEDISALEEEDGN